MKKTLLLLTLTASLSVFSQTTIYTEDFESGNSFTMNTADLGAANDVNTWLMNNAYAGGSGSLICLGFPLSYTITSTPPQPVGISQSPASNYMHIAAQYAIADNISSSSYSPVDGVCFFAESNFTKMSSPISTIGLADISFDFWYLCDGSTNAFGEVYYSLDGGVSWILKQSTLNSTTSWTQMSLTDESWENQSSLLFAFRFVNDNAFTSTVLGFSVDQIEIKSNSTFCTETTSSLTETVCESYTSPSGNYTWTSSNTYMDTIPNAAGCDSVITLDLTINEVDTSLSLSGTVLTSNESGASYAWLDCNTMNLIDGENGQSYTATANGDYAAIVTLGNCIDTSACETIQTVGLDDNQKSSLVSVYPNPSNGLFIISLTESARVEISNLSGKSVLNQNLASGQHNVDLTNFSNGIYIVSIQTAKQKAVIRLIKE